MISHLLDMFLIKFLKKGRRSKTRGRSGAYGLAERSIKFYQPDRTARPGPAENLDRPEPTGPFANTKSKRQTVKAFYESQGCLTQCVQ